eukprot:SAG31_NODE_20071_length_584_cov_1.331959_2_plen_117_part_01
MAKQMRKLPIPNQTLFPSMQVMLCPTTLPTERSSSRTAAPSAGPSSAVPTAQLGAVVDSGSLKAPEVSAPLKPSPTQPSASSASEDLRLEPLTAIVDKPAAAPAPSPSSQQQSESTP